MRVAGRLCKRWQAKLHVQQRPPSTRSTKPHAERGGEWVRRPGEGDTLHHSQLSVHNVKCLTQPSYKPHQQQCVLEVLRAQGAPPAAQIKQSTPALHSSLLIGPLHHRVQKNLFAFCYHSHTAYTLAPLVGCVIQSTTPSSQRRHGIERVLWCEALSELLCVGGWLIKGPLLCPPLCVMPSQTIGKVMIGKLSIPYGAGGP